MKNAFFDDTVDQMITAVNEYQLNIDINHAGKVKLRYGTDLHRIDLITLFRIIFDHIKLDLIRLNLI